MKEGAMNIWVGEKVKLRAFEAEDAEYNFQSWNDSNNLKNRAFLKLPSSKCVTSYFAQKDAETGPIESDFHFIIENMNGETVGDIGTSECDFRFGTFTFGYEIIEQYRRNGFASEAILLMLRYYFYAFRFNKAWTSVYDFNIPSNSLLAKIGFHKEGIQKEMYFLTTASTGQRLLSRFLLSNNRANPLRGTGLPVKQMLDSL
jgi:RimJ/RimL family protein N-acetyltransferase